MRFKKIGAIFSIFFMLFCLFLSSCSKNNTQKNEYSLPYKLDGFSTKATVDLDGKKYHIIISKNDKDSYELSFDSTDEITDKTTDILKNVSFVKTGENFYIFCGKLKIPTTQNSSIYNCIFDIFELTESDILSAGTRTLNGTTIPYANFNFQEKNAVIFFSSKTGLPLRIEGVFNGLPATVNFSDFSVN